MFIYEGRDVDVSHPHLTLTWTQVQIETSLEALVNEARVRGNGPQAGEPLRQKTQLPVLGVLLLPRQPLNKTFTTKTLRSQQTFWQL